jgi:CheY-like chemotaxis protein
VILVVDDDPWFRTTVASLLEEHGFQTTSAADGRDALGIVQRAAGRDLDLILVDLEMPGVNGWEFTRILGSDAAWQKIPVVIVTALEKPNIYGFPILQKPFDIDVLFGLVEAVCGPPPAVKS